MQKNNFKKMRHAKKLLFGAFIIIFFFSFTSLQAQEDTSVTRLILLPATRISASAPSGESTFSVSSINKKDIQSAHGNGSVNNMLDQIPGMITTSDAGNGLGYSYMRIRGIDQTRINVTINGISLNDAESQGSWLVNLPDFASSVESLDVQRGVGSSHNGASAFGASMNFSTLTPAENPFADISSSAGSFYSFRNSIHVGTGLIKKRFSANAGYSNVLSRGFIDHSSAKLHSAFFTGKYNILSEKKNKDYGFLQFNLLYGNEKTGLAWNGVPFDSLATNRTYNSCGEYYDVNGNRKHYENQTDNFQQTHAQLHYKLTRAIADKHYFDFHAALHLTRGIGYYEEYQDDVFAANYGLISLTNPYGNETVTDAITRKYLDNYFYGGIFSFNHTINDKYTWVLGGTANRYQGKEYGTLEWLQWNAGNEKGWHWYDGTGDKRQYNLYAKFIANLRHRKFEYHKISCSHTTLYADIQYRCIDYRIGGFNANLFDVTQSHVWHFINPKAGVNFQWTNPTSYDEVAIRHEVYFTFSTANREPTRSDLTEAAADKRPTPETLYDFELGYLCSGENFRVTADAYFMYYTDQLVLTGEINDVGAAIMSNVDKSFRTGIELTSTYKPLKWFQWMINGTFSLNKILDYTEYVDDWDTGLQRVKKLGTTDISFSPNIVASNQFTFIPVRNFDIALTTKFVSRQYIDNSSRKEYSIDPYCVTNLQLNYKIETKAIPEIAFYFQINNIFNAEYESNAWLYRYYLGGKENRMDGYFPQAGINFMGGITLRF